MAWLIKAQSLLQLLYPSHCCGCKELIHPSSILCGSCFGLIKSVTTIFVPLTEKRSMRVFAASSYDNPLRTLVLRKFASEVLGSKQLGKLMVQLIDFDLLQPDLIVPIPLHWSRYAKRGFNQANIIAKIIGKARNIPVVHLLRRRKKTLFQARLNKVDREKNIAHAFGIHDWYGFRDLSFVQGKRILVVDDLCTTGVTLQQAGKMLLALKPLSITAAVACRAV